jgi:uncharacterized membrane protein YgcG
MQRALLIACIAVLAPLQQVFAAEGYITTFDARVTLHEDASVEVLERISYDFGAEERHGIFRKIPYSYQAGETTYTANVSVLAVTDEEGKPYPFAESRGNGILELKIGDPNVTVTGKHEYAISYIVYGPFLYFDEYDEFYWNVTGSWATGIGRATVLVNLPPGAQALDAACYQGTIDSTASCDESQKLINAEQGGYVASANNLAEGDGFTVAVSFPKGVIALVERPWSPGSDTGPLTYLPFGIPLIVLGALIRLWYTRGRDPKGRTTIVPQYEPPAGMTPSIAGILHNERIEPREISAEIVRLAVEGFVRIHRLEKKVLIFTSADYLLERLSDVGEPKDAVGKLILEKLFQPEFSATEDVSGRAVTGTLLSKMQHKFVKERNEITDVMYNEVLDRGLFIERPDKVRMLYAGVGVAVVVVGGILVGASGKGVLTNLGISIALSGGLTALMGILMPARTREGVLKKEHLEGFKRYLDVAEKDRLAFHNAPERTPKLFDTYLPFAMALGVEKAWAEQFTDIYKEQPQWYSGSTGTFAPAMFAGELSSFSSDFQSASAPQSSGSGGGGSVGGGFGGGGGGSW